MMHLRAGRKPWSTLSEAEILSFFGRHGRIDQIITEVGLLDQVYYGSHLILAGMNGIPAN